MKSSFNAYGLVALAHSLIGPEVLFGQSEVRFANKAAPTKIDGRSEDAKMPGAHGLDRMNSGAFADAAPNTQ